MADGCNNGVDLGYSGPRHISIMPPNHTSALQNRDDTTALLLKSVLKGHTVAWFTKPPFRYFICNPVGLVPKSGAEPPWRVIEDPSALWRGDTLPSVFAGLSSTDFTSQAKFSYDSIDEAFRAVWTMGKGAYLLVFDKKGAFTTIPVRPQDRHLLGIHWPGLGFAYGAVCKFGFRASSYRWELYGGLFTSLLRERWGVWITCRWVDDYLLVASLCRTEALRLAALVAKAARRYNFILAEDKFVLAQTLLYLGYWFDTNLMTVSIPLQKRTDAIQTLASLIATPSWGKARLESILGIVFYFSRLLRPLWGLLGRLLKLKASRTASLRPSPQTFVDLKLLRSILKA